ELGRTGDPVAPPAAVALHGQARIRAWANARVRPTVRAGGTPARAASLGKVHGASLNQRLQLLAADLLGMASTAWEDDATPFEVQGMLRSRANTIEGG